MNKGGITMNLATNVLRQYDQVPVEQDVLYFKVGHHGLVSFHGENFHMRKRVSSEQLAQWIQNPKIFKVNTDCYVNLEHIQEVSNGKVYFQQPDRHNKVVAITKLRQYALQEILQLKQSSLSTKD
jgi:hypothetical protein